MDRVSKFDPITLICLAVLAVSAVYGIIKGDWRPAVWVAAASCLIFCLRSILTDMTDDSKSTEMSEAFENDFEGPADVTLICHRMTFGTLPFYVYCKGKCVAKISRGDELRVRLPSGAIDIGLIRIEGLTPRKYAHMEISGGERIHICPDKNDAKFPYRLVSAEDDPDDSIFEEHYRKQKSDSLRMSIGVTAFVVLLFALIFVFLKPF